MNQDHVDFAEMALELIEENGREVTFFYETAGGYDVTTDNYVSAGTVSKTVISAESKFSSKEIDGTNILSKDKLFLVAAMSLPQEPDNRYKLQDGDATYTVVNTQVVKPGDVAILYKVQVRR